MKVGGRSQDMLLPLSRHPSFIGQTGELLLTEDSTLGVFVGYAAFAVGVWVGQLPVVNADDVKKIPHQKST